MFKNLIAFTSLFLLLADADAQQIKTPQPSPTQTIKQDFGISSIELSYSRPGVKGRKIFGDLVPYGKVWRTGANAATRIKFADSVKIGGQPVAPGEYALYTVPGEKEWEVVVNKGIGNWGAFGYKTEDDVARFKVKAINTPEAMETFTMQFANVKANSTDLRIWWDKTAIMIPITADFDRKILAQIDNAINRDNRPYFSAAMYYLETGRDLNKAVEWFDKAIENNPGGFWIYHQKANALAKLGKKEEARITAQKSMDIAKEQDNDDYVELNRKLLAALK